MMLFRRAFLLCLPLVLSGGAVLAQGEDARVLPRGAVGLRVGGEFTHFGSRLGGGDPALGAPLTTAFPASLFPAALGPVRTGLETFFARTGGAFLAPDDLSLGTLEFGLAADQRRVPISLEAGVLSRLTLRATLPLERRESEGTGLRLVDPGLGLNATTRQDSLAKLLARIDPALASVGRLTYLPVATSRAGQEMQQRYTRATGDATALPLPERGLSEVQLNSLLGSAQLGSLPEGTSRRNLLPGDAEVAARFQLLNPAGDSLAARGGVRVALEAGVRLPTGLSEATDSLTAVIGDVGHAGAFGGVFADLFLGERFWGSAFARRTVIGARDVERLTWTPGAPYRPLGAAVRLTRDPGDVTEVGITPRYRLTDELSLSLGYGFLQIGETSYSGETAIPAGAALAGLESTASRSAQLLGLGASYSTRDAFLAGRTPLPLEVEFSFRSVVAGSGGVEDASVATLAGRVFYPAWGRRPSR